MYEFEEPAFGVGVEQGAELEVPGSAGDGYGRGHNVLAGASALPCERAVALGAESGAIGDLHRIDVGALHRSGDAAGCG